MDQNSRQLYIPLLFGRIRLLLINTQTSTAEVGTLVEVSLDAAPPYYALSHCWTHQKTTTKIQMGDHSLVIGSELATCIHRLRELAFEPSLAEPIRYVWVDSICIDQGNATEQSSQVQQMGRIYSQSVRTLIWLGQCAPLWSGALSIIDRICYISSSQGYQDTEYQAKAYSPSDHVASGLPDWGSPLWSQLKAMLESGWFSRIWVVQEAVLSPQDPLIIVGSCMYPWHRLGQASAWLRRNGYIRLSQIPAELLNVDAICEIRSSALKWPLDALLSFTQIKFRATDQRDKVYSLLGLIERGQGLDLPHALRPDYQESVLAMYQRVAQFILTESRSLGLLSRTRGTGKSLSKLQRLYDYESLPSWVPDWSDFRVFNRDLRTSLSWIHYSNEGTVPRLGFPDHYSASAGLEAKIHPSQDISRLRISGIRVSKLAQVGPCNEGNLTRKDFQNVFPLLLADICNKAAPLLSRGRMFEWTNHLVRTTTADQHQLFGYGPEQCLRNGAACLLGMLRTDAHLASRIFKLGGKEPLTTLQRMSKGGKSEEFLLLASNYCFNRCFFITSCGRMGIGPSDASVGDDCAILLGGEVVYVIRQKQDDWIFVGESYVSGLMSGEAIQSCEKGVFQEEILDFV